MLSVRVKGCMTVLGLPTESGIGPKPPYSFSREFLLTLSLLIDLFSNDFFSSSSTITSFLSEFVGPLAWLWELDC